MKLAKQQQDKDSADTNQPTHSSAKHKKRQFQSGDMGDLTGTESRTAQFP